MGRIRDYRPPLRIDASYAATAWTRAVEDEHRLLSQLLAILYAFPHLPGDVAERPPRARTAPVRSSRSRS